MASPIPYARHADPPSRAAAIERSLALAILRGEHAPGTRLPSVRELAREHETTPPTLQRVIDRLDSAGLVSARRGSGVTVNDPTRRLDPTLLPLWFEVLSDQPRRASQILGDFLELRRVVAAHLFRTRYEAIRSAVPELARLVAPLRRNTPLGEVVAIDRALTETIVRAAGQVAVSAVFSVTEELIDGTPWVAEALWSNRKDYEAVVAGITEALGCGDAQHAAEILEATLAPWDAKVVARFARKLRAQGNLT